MDPEVGKLNNLGWIALNQLCLFLVHTCIPECKGENRECKNGTSGLGTCECKQGFLMADEVLDGPCKSKMDPSEFSLDMTRQNMT